MRTRVQQAVDVELLCVILFVILITPLIATTQTDKLAQTITTLGPFQVTVPVGEYVALQQSAIVSTPIPANDYNILLYGYGWTLNGDVDGDPINIYVLNSSNYQDFASGRRYSMFQQFYNVSGLFKLNVTVWLNVPVQLFDPNGTSILQGLNVTDYWWFIFDNKPSLSTGLFDARLSVSSIIYQSIIGSVHL
jgi:hypothetical protein